MVRKSKKVNQVQAKLEAPKTQTLAELLVEKGALDECTARYLEQQVCICIESALLNQQRVRVVASKHGLGGGQGRLLAEFYLGLTGRDEAVPCVRLGEEVTADLRRKLSVIRSGD